MTEAALVVFVVFAILALFELEQIRKDATLIRALMEMDGSTWRAACKDIGSIRQMLYTELLDERARRQRRERN